MNPDLSHPTCCSQEQLLELLSSPANTVLIDIERHIESCESCRHRLQQLAGDSQWWRETGQQLSSIEDLNGVGSASSGLEKRSRRDYALQLLDPPSHPEMLGRIGRYEVESVIGQGGFGIVYKAHDTELHRPVAIKVLSPHLASSGVARKRFAREAQAVAAVNHPNVVPIHAVEAQADLPYLVMTYVPGHSLQTLVMKQGPLDPVAIVRIGKQIAAGLAAAHRQGLVHRDIKPANILLENDLNRAMITDFGLARAADDAGVTQTGWLAGTPHYMSPEQARGQDIDSRSDLFSLGSVLYFMATGREPFRGDTPLAILRRIGEFQPLSARQINAEIPRTLSLIIDRLLEKKPRDRYASADEVERLFEQYLAHLQHPQTRLPPKPGVARRVWRQRLMALAVVALLGTGGLAWSAIRGAGEIDGPGPVGKISAPSAIATADRELKMQQFLVEIEKQKVFQMEIELLADGIDRLEQSILRDPLRIEPNPTADPILLLIQQLDHELDQVQRQLE